MTLPKSETTTKRGTHPRGPERTPGEWLIEWKGDYSPLRIVAPDVTAPSGSREVAAVPRTGDANLIAAGPTLLAAAEALLKKLAAMTTKDFARSWEKVERDELAAAVRKAKGIL